MKKHLQTKVPNILKKKTKDQHKLLRVQTTKNKVSRHFRSKIADFKNCFHGSLCF